MNGKTQAATVASRAPFGSMIVSQCQWVKTFTVKDFHPSFITSFIHLLIHWNARQREERVNGHPFKVNEDPTGSMHLALIIIMMVVVVIV